MIVVMSAQAKVVNKRPLRDAVKGSAKTKRRHSSFSDRSFDDLKQTPDSQARLDKWYRDAKFGALVCFGPYSTLAGRYKDRIGSRPYGEWIQISAEISSREYRQEVVARFNPVEFDAEQWVRVYKETGLQYIVVTAKFHDGFAMYDSQFSDYNIINATPFKRDVIKELSEACHRNGLKFGVYYSQAQDWNEPDAPHSRDIVERRTSLHPDLPADFKPDMDRYIAIKALPQVEELVKNYEIDLIWFDTPAEMTFERARLFTDMVRKYRPDCLINSRLIHHGRHKIEPKHMQLFDYVSLGDKKIPTKRLPVYFETPDSVSSSYGYKKYGPIEYHTEKELIERFVHTVCSGGNYMLNNGPMGNGKLDPEAVRLYRAIGTWMKVNGESLLNTRPNPFTKRPAWGDVCVSKDGKVLYLHILEWPKSGEITLGDLSGKVKAASYLENNKAAEFKQDGDVLSITLPSQPVSKYDTVIKVIVDN